MGFFDAWSKDHTVDFKIELSIDSNSVMFRHERANGESLDSIVKKLSENDNIFKIFPDTPSGRNDFFLKQKNMALDAKPISFCQESLKTNWLITNTL